ncbi:MAG: aminoglycoside phosphotransferase family protein [Chloroflexota bacterium]
MNDRPTAKMHDDEVDTSPALVRQLLADQFPHWAHLPLKPVPSAGTDHAIYRLGTDKAVRLPRIGWATGQAEKERHWLPRLGPQLPLAVPQPLALGQPAAGYPWAWSVYRWLPGQNVASDTLTNPGETAVALAHFLAALQQIDTRDGPLAAAHHLRGAPLITRDEAFREAVAALPELYDRTLLTAIWEAALQAPGWDRAPVWFHGDVLPGNLLFVNGRLSAIIDFGGLGVGDPACDLMIAWNLFTAAGRAVLRQALAVDEATWARGRGHALAQAVIFIPYYLETNPVGVAYARRAVAEIVAEWQQEGN